MRRPASLVDHRASPHTESAIGRLAALAAPLASRLPAFPGSVLLAAGLNLAFGNAVPSDLEPLWGKVVALRASDAGFRFQFQVTGAGFVASRRSSPPAVTISAGLRDFVQLARRRVDPDTLFFARRLVIEGNTELGLLLKNRLDALDLSAVSVRRLRPSDVVTGFGTALRAAFRSKAPG
jgi:O2-independent ubiquinone biosynthesis accessory factor UbiT